MKIISLWPPWAQLVSLNLKRIETRSWKAPEVLIGQRIGIHVTKKMPAMARRFCRKFALLLGYTVENYNGSWLYYLEQGIGNFGKIIATAKLCGCYKIINNDVIGKVAYIDVNGLEFAVTGNEYEFGDYRTGRYVWMLEDIQQLPNPIPAKGMQRLWNWDGEL